MKHARWAGLWVVLVLVGCAAPSKAPPTTASQPVMSPGNQPITNTDPCATQMHDLCGAFLLFYAANYRLPHTLDELASFPGNDQIVLTCPVSGQPYVYNPVGILLAERNARVILYDPTSAHSGFRWAIQIEEPVYDQPLVTKVVALPDGFFLLRKQPR